MEKTSKRIIMSILTLVLVVVALGTTTFAWFTLSNVALVNNIEANVIAGEGLEVAIAIDGENVTGFKSNLGASDWTLVMNHIALKESKAFEFNAVSTANGNDFTKVAITNGNASIGQDAEANVDYLAIEILFRSQTAGSVDITGITIDNTVGGQTFEPEQEYEQTPAGAPSKMNISTRAANAARVLIKNAEGTNLGNYQLSEGNPAYNVGTTVITGNAANNEPVSYGQWSYLVNMGEVLYNKPVYDVDGTTILSHDPIDPATDFANITVYSATQLSAFATIASASTLTQDPIDTAFFTGQISVLIWLEGWDADAYDSIFQSLLSVSLAFERQD